MITPLEVLHAFTALTGIALRRPSYNQEMTALEFAKSFTLDELESVVRFVQREIAGGRLDARSLQWHCIFGTMGSGSEFEVFQSRLAMAQKTVRLRAAPVPVAVTTDTGSGKVTVLDFKQPDEATPEMREAIAASMAELKARLSA